MEKVILAAPLYIGQKQKVRKSLKELSFTDQAEAMGVYPNLMKQNLKNSEILEKALDSQRQLNMFPTKS